jgi:hypothetical protein
MPLLCNAAVRNPATCTIHLQGHKHILHVFTPYKSITWVLIDKVFVMLLLFSPICLFICMVQTLCSGFTMTTERLAWSFILTFRYIDDVHSLNNSKLGDNADRMFPTELELMDTKDTATSASQLELHLKLTTRTGWQQEMILISSVWTLHRYVATFQKNLQMEYITVYVIVKSLLFLSGCPW